MIISRSPLRITLGGGGTDLPSYYKKKGGFLIAAAINKYVYVTIIRPFKKGIYLKYSKIEKVKKILQINHPIIRETLKLQKIKTPQIEITTLTDIFLVCSSDSDAQSRAITNHIQDGLKNHNIRPIHIEGYQHLKWVLIDYVNIVINIFNKFEVIV